MFDIGFSELIIVAIVTLLVVGPERLPETIKTAALWLGRARGMLSDAKETIKEEIGVDDIRQTLHNENVMKDLKDAKQKVNQSLNSARSFESGLRDQIEQSVNDTGNTIHSDAGEPVESSVPNEPAIPATTAAQPLASSPAPSKSTNPDSSSEH